VQFGYSLEIGRGVGTDATRAEKDVVVSVSPDGFSNKAVVTFRGFRLEVPFDPLDPAGSIAAYFGAAPTTASVFDRGAISRQVEAAMPDQVQNRVGNYPRTI
jgi:hypothetical protein